MLIFADVDAALDDGGGHFYTGHNKAADEGVRLRRRRWYRKAKDKAQAEK